MLALDQSRTWTRIIPLVFFIVGLSYFCFRIVGVDLAYVPGDLGDSRFINYLLEHGYRFISGKTDGFWNAPFMYPYSNSVGLSDNMLGTLPVYAVFRALGCGRETAFQLWWIAICTLNYWISYLVFRKWSGNLFVSVVCAYIFAFTIFNLGQLNYMQMMIRFNVPVIMYAAFKLATSPRHKYLVIYMIALVYQFYCVMYTGFFSLYFSGIFMFTLCIAFRAWKFPLYYFQRKNILRTGLILTGAVISMLPLVFPYSQAASDTGLRLYHDVVPNLPTVQSLFFANESSMTWSVLSEHGKTAFTEWWLQDIFTGILPWLFFIAAIIVSIRYYRGRITISKELVALTLTACAVFLIFLRTESNLTLFGAIFKFPGMNSMRVLTRFMHVQLFFMLISGALVLMSVSNNKRNWMVTGLLLFAVIDNLFNPELLPRVQKKELSERIEVMENKMSASCSGKVPVVYLSDGSQPAYVNQLDAMLAAQSLGLKCINGYSSSCQPAYGPFLLQCDSVGLETWIIGSQLNRDSICILR